MFSSEEMCRRKPQERKNIGKRYITEDYTKLNLVTVAIDAKTT